MTDGRRMFLALMMLGVVHGQPASVEGAPLQTGDQGEAVFQAKCAACHSLGTDRVVGPGLAGVTERRDGDWLAEFVATPDRMIAAGDSIATRLLAEYQVPMPNLALTADEVTAVLAYIDAAPAAVETGPAAALAPGDPDIGRLLFTGERALTNGGPACISCHAITGLSAPGGGTLAADLTTSATTYGAGLSAVLGTTPFPVMQEIFPDRPLTETEIADLVAFLGRANVRGGAAEAGLAFPVAGAAGTLFLLVLTGILWRSRLRGVRKPLIGGRS